MIVVARCLLLLFVHDCCTLSLFVVRCRCRVLSSLGVDIVFGVVA